MLWVQDTFLQFGRQSNPPDWSHSAWQLITWLNICPRNSKGNCHPPMKSLNFWMAWNERSSITFEVTDCDFKQLSKLEVVICDLKGQKNWGSKMTLQVGMRSNRHKRVQELSRPFYHHRQQNRISFRRFSQRPRQKMVRILENGHRGDWDACKVGSGWHLSITAHAVSLRCYFLVGAGIRFFLFVLAGVELVILGGGMCSWFYPPLMADK